MSHFSRTQYTEKDFINLIEMMDQIQDAVAVDDLESVSSLTPRDLMGLLHDLHHTVGETMTFIQSSHR